MLANSFNTQLSTSTAFGSQSQSKTVCLLITGKNRQNLPIINHCGELISARLSVQTRTEAQKITNSAFCEREFSWQILMKITGSLQALSGDIRQVSGKTRLQSQVVL